MLRCRSARAQRWTHYSSSARLRSMMRSQSRTLLQGLCRQQVIRSNTAQQPEPKRTLLLEVTQALGVLVEVHVARVVAGVVDGLAALAECAA